MTVLLLLSLLLPVPVPSPADTLRTIDEIAGALATGGDRAAVLEALSLRAASPVPERATLWIQVLSVVERTGAEASAAAVRAAGLGDLRQGSEGARLIQATLERAPRQDHPPLLALGALLTEEVDPLLAAELRERLLTGFPEGPERPEILFRQARWLVSIDARRGEGLSLLEDFIVAYPTHPLTPEARRIFQQARSRR